MTKIYLIISSFLTLCLSCQAQEPTLTITGSNFQNDIGKAVVNLFRKQDDVPKKPFRTASAGIVNGEATIEFKNLPYGDYAAVLFHDENSNNVIDHRFGFPNEPIGFSNDWRLSFFSGMPTFEKLKFRFYDTVPYKIVIR